MSPATPTSNNDILIFHRAGQLPAQLRETLQGKGHSSRVINDMRELLPTLSELTNPILMIDCGTAESEGYEIIKNLVSNEALHSFPILVVGKAVDEYEGVLNRYFKAGTTINAPYSIPDIIEAIAYLAKSKPKAAPVEPPARAPAPEVRPKEPPPTILPEQPAHELFGHYGSIPDLFFDQINRLNLLGLSLGGEGYTNEIDQKTLEQAGIFPKDPNIVAAVNTVTNDLGNWGRLHLFRVTYVLQRILEGLKLPDSAKEQALLVPLLMPMSFAANNAELCRREFLDSRSGALRKELCSRIKDSAMKIAVDLKQPDVANLMAKVARLIGAEDPIGNDEASLVASAIMATDLTDRICFQSGHWNPRRAYRIMHKFKSGTVKDIHPAVMCCVIKLLSETIASRTAAFLLPREIRNDPVLLSEALRTREQSVGEKEIKVPIAKLEPGMRLSRPLLAFDGRKILAEDLTLDQDLIWRIWQLSAVRPLNAPLVVVSEN